MKPALVLSTLMAAQLASPLTACPAFISASELRMPLAAKRSELHLFAIEENAKGERLWRTLPLQVDPMNAEQLLLSPKEEGNRPSDSLAPNDRISMRMEGFASRIRTSDASPCAANQAIELQDPENLERFGYLVACNTTKHSTANSMPQPVSHDANQFHIRTPYYHYNYQTNNQLMYKSLTVIDQDTNAHYRAGSAADLMLHLDIKRFFTINFDNEDVESYVEATHGGPVGLATRIDFYLRMLFFKIDLKMATSASFFADAAHIPTIIDAPVHSKKRLHPGSGIAYTWKLDQSLIGETVKSESVPTIPPALIKEGWQKLANRGLAHCFGDPCIYRLNGTVGNQKWQMEFQVPRLLVENGFYPIWIPNVAEFVKGMEWDDAPSPDLQQSVAIYFENSGVPKGQHRLDQWIRLLGPSQELGSYACPRPVRQRRIVEISP